MFISGPFSIAMLVYWRVILGVLVRHQAGVQAEALESAREARKLMIAYQRRHVSNGRVDIRILDDYAVISWKKCDDSISFILM